MHGDRVVARVERYRDGDRPEGRIVRILERANATVVGRYDVDDGRPRLRGAVRPAAARGRGGAAGEARGAQPGQMVTVGDHPLADRDARAPSAASPRCSGTIDDPGVDTRIIIRKYGLPDAHGAEAVAEARRMLGRRRDAAHHARPQAGPRRPHRLPRPGHRHHRRRARARLRRCDLGRAAAERALLARRPHRRRLALRARGQRARQRGVRARAPRCISPSARCTCSPRSWRPASAA